MRDHVGPLLRDAAPQQPPRCGIQIAGLRHLHGTQRLLDIPSLHLEAPGPSVIVGPNGAGKSLFLRLLHGLLPAPSGAIRIHHTGAGPVRQAMVFQKPVLLRRSVAANIAFALAARGVPRHDRKSRVAALLAHGRLDHKARQPARSLSGGEQQRLAVLRALATEPALLLLDEPTAPLDPAATQEIESLIQSADASGTKVIMVTHDLGQARRLAAAVVLLHHGQVVEHAPAPVFFTRPETSAARIFLAGGLLR